MISQSTVRNSLTNDCRYKFIELIRTLIQKVNCSTSIKIFYTIIPSTSLDNSWSDGGQLPLEMLPEVIV